MNCRTGAPLAVKRPPGSVCPRDGPSDRLRLMDATSNVAAVGRLAGRLCALRGTVASVELHMRAAATTKPKSEVRMLCLPFLPQLAAPNPSLIGPDRALALRASRPVGRTLRDPGRTMKPSAARGASAET